MNNLSDIKYPLVGAAPSVVREDTIEYGVIDTLQGLKYTYRPDIRDRAALEKNFRDQFEALNRVRLTDSAFARLLDEIVTADVFSAAKTLREINAFTRRERQPRFGATLHLNSAIRPILSSMSELWRTWSLNALTGRSVMG